MENLTSVIKASFEGKKEKVEFILAPFLPCDRLRGNNENCNINDLDDLQYNYLSELSLIHNARVLNKLLDESLTTAVRYCTYLQNISV